MNVFPHFIPCNFLTFAHVLICRFCLPLLSPGTVPCRKFYEQTNVFLRQCAFNFWSGREWRHSSRFLFWSSRFFGSIFIFFVLLFVSGFSAMRSNCKASIIPDLRQSCKLSCYGRYTGQDLRFWDFIWDDGTEILNVIGFRIITKINCK